MSKDPKFQTAMFHFFSVAVNADNVVALMAVVFVFLLAVLMVLAIVRMRASHQRQQATAAAEEEMAWDDSALNITVNPLEVRETNALSCSCLTATTTTLLLEVRSATTSCPSYEL